MYTTRRPQINMSSINTLQQNVMMERWIKEVAQLHQAFLDKLEETIHTIEKKVGPKGDKPTQTEILNAVREVMPKISREVLNEIIKPHIPKVKDGITPTKEQLLNLITPLIPKEKDIIITDEHLDKIADKASKKIRPNEKRIIEIDEINPLSILEKIMALPEAKHLDPDYIKGTEQTIRSIQSQLKHGYLHGGGISNIIAGNNIVITSNGNGSFTITSTGGINTPAETPDGSRVAFTVISKPEYVISEQGFAIEGYGYSYLNNIITFSISPSQFVRYFI